MELTADSTIPDMGLTTQAPKTLAEGGITTVAQLLIHTRDELAALKGMGARRLADLDMVMAGHRLVYGQPIERRVGGAVCPTCKRCPDCGNSRADDRRHIATDLSGRASHLGHRVGPTCPGCDRHHRSLFTTVTTAEGN
jgi:predicted RecB family nuclease